MLSLIIQLKSNINVKEILIQETNIILGGNRKFHYYESYILFSSLNANSLNLYQPNIILK